MVLLKAIMFGVLIVITASQERHDEPNAATASTRARLSSILSTSESAEEFNDEAAVSEDQSRGLSEGMAGFSKGMSGMSKAMRGFADGMEGMSEAMGGFSEGMSGLRGK